MAMEPLFIMATIADFDEVQMSQADFK